MGWGGGKGAYILRHPQMSGVTIYMDKGFERVNGGSVIYL